MPPAWKVRRGHLVIGSSVCLSVRLSVRNSVPLTNKVQFLKFGWWYSNQTWTVSSSMGSSHFTDMTCPWGWDRSKIELRDFCHISTLLPPGASVFHKHMSCLSIENVYFSIFWMYIILRLLYTGKIIAPFYFHPFRPLVWEFKTGLIELNSKDYVRKLESGQN